MPPSCKGPSLVQTPFSDHFLLGGVGGDFDRSFAPSLETLEIIEQDINQSVRQLRHDLLPQPDEATIGHHLENSRRE